MGGERGGVGLVVALLGPVEIGPPGGVMAPVAQPRLRVLLGLLGVAFGRLVSAEALVDGVWGEEWSPGREKNLHALVYQLRRRLEQVEPGNGGGRLVRAGGGYRLGLGAGELDVAVFGDLAGRGRAAARVGDTAGARELFGQALGCWRGQALADAAPLCPVLAGEAARLEEARAAVLEERIGCDLALGRHGEVVGELAALVGEFPLRERLAGLLMTALYRCGRRGEALAVFDAARRVLAEELGLDPGPELAGLQAKVLADNLALAVPAPSVPLLHVSLLGEQAIVDDRTGRVRTRSSRTVALVAFLAAHAGLPQARQRIAGLFWQDSTEAQALTNLRRELHNLRQVLGDDGSLAVTPRDLCWHDCETCVVDVRVFGVERQAALAAAAADDVEAVVVHASRAVAEYRGDFLPGLYDDWLLEIRSELERQCVGLCDLLCAARTRSGDLAGAVDAARRRIQLQPLEEAGYRTLMLLLADLGDRAGAVSTYHRCVSVLEREVGVVPDPATQQIFRRLISEGRPAVTGPLEVDPAGDRSGLVAARLVGRSCEVGLLQDMWRACAAGSPGLVLVRGGAGVGKSRLVAEIASLARRQGAVVASSQCFGTSGRVALAPVADWIRAPAVQSATATLDPPWRAEVRRLVPSAGRGERAAGARAMVDAWQRHRFFEGLARALIAVDRPMLLVLDNLQWCDQETLAFVTFFLTLASGSPVLVAGTLRDDSLDEDPDLASWIVAMRASGLVTELTLDPLEAADTARLAEAISGRPLAEADADLLQATTGGFPLFVIEAVRSMVDPGSAPVPAGDLTAVLRSRIEQATGPAREVAGLAAAVGADFTLDLLTEASDLDAGPVVAAVDELWRRRLVHEFGDGYDFSHDLLRDAAYTLVSPPKRWLLHRRVAQALELLHAGNTDIVAAQLAEQYARGGRLRHAVDYYRRAADAAAGLFAYAEAIRLHTKALETVSALPAGPDRDRQELAVLDAMAAPLNARYGYASPEVQHALERSVALAESLGQKDSTLTGLVALSTSRFVQGRTADGYQLAARALALAQDGSDLCSPAHFAVGANAVSLGRPAEGLRHLQLAVELASGAVSLSVGTRPEVHATAFAAHARWLLGQDDAARSACDAAIELARSAGHPYNLAVALAYAGITHQMRKDLSGLSQVVSELRELCDRYGFAYYGEWGLILDGWSRAGAPGMGLARRGISNLRSQGSFARMPYWLSLLADLQARNGRVDAARATLDAALSAGQAHDDVWWLPEVMRLRASYDQEQAAVSRLLSAAQMASAHGSIALVRRCERDLAQRGVRRRASGALPRT